MNNQFEMVLAIVNTGYTEDVMEAVKACGAKGGTILNARGTANTEIEKFEKQNIKILFFHIISLNQALKFL